MKAVRVCLVVALFAMSLSACVEDPGSPRGFSLPEGDPVLGEKVFVDADCLACHSLSGFDDQAEKELATVVALGGEVTRVKTYADLVTSIINPSHRLAAGYDEDAISDRGESVMRNYNDLLTVTELIDLVAFLQTHYTIKEFEPIGYPPYYP